MQVRHDPICQKAQHEFEIRQKAQQESSKQRAKGKKGGGPPAQQNAVSTFVMCFVFLEQT